MGVKTQRILRTIAIILYFPLFFLFVATVGEWVPSHVSGEFWSTVAGIIFIIFWVVILFVLADWQPGRKSRRRDWIPVRDRPEYWKQDAEDDEEEKR